jgi:hypothetical protein
MLILTILPSVPTDPFTTSRLALLAAGCLAVAPSLVALGGSSCCSVEACRSGRAGRGGRVLSELAAQSGDGGLQVGDAS